MKKEKVGTFLGAPYDWRHPTQSLIKKRLWNPDDERIFTPKFYGWGWTCNFYQIFRKLGFIKKG